MRVIDLYISYSVPAHIPIGPFIYLDNHIILLPPSKLASKPGTSQAV